MKNVIHLSFLAVAVLTVFAFSSIPSQKWEVDKAHSGVNFSITHFFTPVNGRFENYKGTFLFDANNLTESKVDFTIQVASVNTQNAKRDKHLQSGDFFNAESFPDIRFVSTKIVKKGKNKYLAHGKLTIKDVTKDIALPFTVLGTTDHPMMKGTKVMSIKAETTINRNHYGVGTGDWAATMVVGSDVNIEIIMEVNSKVNS